MFDLVPWRKQQKGGISRLHRKFDDQFSRFFGRDFAVSGDPRPLILCEYAHAMGNSVGNLQDSKPRMSTYLWMEDG